MTIPIITLDIDGVLAEFTGAFMQEAAHLYPGSVLEWHTSAGAPTWKHEGLSRSETDGVWDYIYEHPFWWRDCLTLIPSAAEVAELFRFTMDIGAHVEYVTARGTARKGRHAKEVREATQHWLLLNGFPASDHVTQVKDKAAGLRTLIDWAGEYSGQSVKLLGHLEDKPSIIEGLRGQGLPVVAYDWPYNRHLGHDRVTSLGEFTALMRLRQNEIG